MTFWHQIEIKSHFFLLLQFPLYDLDESFNLGGLTLNLQMTLYNLSFMFFS